jgi:hypothetical protein
LKIKLFPVLLFLLVLSTNAFAKIPAPALSEPVKNPVLYGIQIKGQAIFVQKTKAALNLLNSRNGLSVIKQYVGVIQEAKSSGMKAWLEPPVYEVGAPTWNNTDIWYAGTIAHDAYHSKLYHEAKAKNFGKEPDESAWTGKEAEKICLDYQLAILQKIGADKKILDYVAGLAKDPQYQNIPYAARRW